MQVSILSKLYVAYALLLGILILPNTSYAQSLSDSNESKNAVFLFSYYPSAGMQVQFEAGYKQHLEWHREFHDPLTWYGWYIMTGDRLGLFIDGTFGVSFDDFDNRVEPQKDRADFAETTAPFAELDSRRIYLYREDLSLGKLLEESNPSLFVQVQFFVIRTGRENEFEKLLGDIADRIRKQSDMPRVAWYQLVDGEEQSGYMLMIPRQSFAGYDLRFTSLGKIVESINDESITQQFEAFTGAIKKVYSESWMYRADLSNFPERN